MKALLIVRRIHLYLALFLTPWILMYALSTLVMNHREQFIKYYGGPIVQFEKERELPYTASFPPGTEPRMKAEHILSDLGLEGAFAVPQGPEDGPLTIVRNDPLAPRRIIYTPREGKIVVMRQVPRLPVTLIHLHHRTGYQHRLINEDLWAFSVDLTIAALIFWVVSGVWIWWDLRPTRLWGAVSGAAGVGLFVLLLLTI